MKKKIYLLALLSCVIMMVSCSSSSKNGQTSVDDQEMTSDDEQEGASDEEHEWVDLGLPSGTKWATTNIGASSPTEVGDYFAWAETSPKENYSMSNLKYHTNTISDPYGGGKQEEYSKYVLDERCGNIDNLNELDTKDDAAFVNWGKKWRTPSAEQFKELLSSCECKVTKKDEEYVVLFTGPNGNYIILPLGGYQNSLEPNAVGEEAYYWTRNLAKFPGYEDQYYTNYAASFKVHYWIDHISKDMGRDERCYGMNIRPVTTE